MSSVGKEPFDIKTSKTSQQEAFDAAVDNLRRAAQGPEFTEGLGETGIASEDAQPVSAGNSARVTFMGEKTKPQPGKPKEIITTQRLESGYKADEGKAKMSLLPPNEILELADLYTLGAKKYSAYNYQLGMDFSRVYDAMLRHAFKFWRGETYDEVDHQTHLVSVAWCALTLLYYMNNYSRYERFDDRPPWTDEKIKESLNTAAKK